MVFVRKGALEASRVLIAVLQQREGEGSAPQVSKMLLDSALRRASFSMPLHFELTGKLRVHVIYDRWRHALLMLPDALRSYNVQPSRSRSVTKVNRKPLGEHARAPQVRGATWCGRLLRRLANSVQPRVLTWNDNSRGVRRALTSNP